jgi:hypothetical protein
MRNAWPLQPDERVQDVRGYILHVPTRRLVRDVFVADGLWTGAAPKITYLLPGPRGGTPRPDEDGLRHYANVHLTAPIETLPTNRGHTRCQEAPTTKRRPPGARARGPRQDDVPRLALRHHLSGAHDGNDVVARPPGDAPGASERLEAPMVPGPPPW